MPRDLTDSELAKVEQARKSTKPKVFDPNGTEATTISNDFESFLILANRDVKQRTIKQIKALLDAEADKDYRDLFAVASRNEAASLKLETGDLDETTSTFTEWREDPGISGWQDVAEIGWLVQELQQGLNPLAEKEEITHLDALREGAAQRLVTSQSSMARRETRLKAFIAAISSY